MPTANATKARTWREERQATQARPASEASTRAPSSAQPRLLPAEPAEPFAEDAAVEDALQVAGPDVVGPQRLDRGLAVAGQDRHLDCRAERVAGEDRRVAAVAGGEQTQRRKWREEPHPRGAEPGGEDEEAAEHGAGGRPRRPQQHPEGGEEHVPEDVGAGADRLQRGDRREHGEGDQGAAQVGVADVAGGGEPDDEAAERGDEGGGDDHCRSRVAQRHRGTDLADQPRDQDQVAGVGGEEGVEGAVFEGALEEDRAVLGPERFQRVADPEAGQLQEHPESQEGDREQRQLAAVGAGLRGGRFWEEAVPNPLPERRQPGRREVRHRRRTISAPQERSRLAALWRAR